MNNLDGVSKEEFASASSDEYVDEKKQVFVVKDEEFDSLLVKIENPVEAQVELAVRLKKFLDAKIDKELGELGDLSDNTRKWTEQFNRLLDSIQKNKYGDKTVNFHTHMVTHADIVAKMRRVKSGDGGGREPTDEGFYGRQV